jgi:hypothetical protein
LVPYLNSDLLDGTADGDLYWNAPGDGNSWMVASSTTDLTSDNAVNVEASARCWNPRANVADSHAVTAPARSLSPRDAREAGPGRRQVGVRMPS